MGYLFSYWTLIPLLIGGGIAAWFFWPVVIGFLSTPLGRRVAAIGGVVLAFVFTFIEGKRRGAKGVTDQLQANSDKLEEQRNKTDAELQKLPADDLVKRSDKWLRP